MTVEGRDWHLGSCPKESFKATGCDCGFVQALVRDGPQWPLVPRGVDGPYVASRVPSGPLVDIGPLLADLKRRAGRVE